MSQQKLTDDQRIENRERAICFGIGSPDGVDAVILEKMLEANCRSLRCLESALKLPGAIPKVIIVMAKAPSYVTIEAVKSLEESRRQLNEAGIPVILIQPSVKLRDALSRFRTLDNYPILAHQKMVPLFYPPKFLESFDPETEETEE